MLGPILYKDDVEDGPAAGVAQVRNNTPVFPLMMPGLMKIFSPPSKSRCAS